MRKLTRTILTLALAGAALGGCAPHLKMLGTCTTGKYRYANPNGTTLPQLAVPSPDDLNGPPQASPQAASPTAPDPTPTPAPIGKYRRGKHAPVAAPPQRGAMLLPSSGQIFRSC